MKLLICIYYQVCSLKICLAANVLSLMGSIAQYTEHLSYISIEITPESIPEGTVVVLYLLLIE